MNCIGFGSFILHTLHVETFSSENTSREPIAWSAITELGRALDERLHFYFALGAVIILLVGVADPNPANQKGERGLVFVCECGQYPLLQPRIWETAR